jgi:hypothetical protein
MITFMIFSGLHSSMEYNWAGHILSKQIFQQLFQAHHNRAGYTGNQVNNLLLLNNPCSTLDLDYQYIPANKGQTSEFFRKIHSPRYAQTRLLSFLAKTERFAKAG